MHSFTFNGHSSEEFGIRIERFPDLNRSERKYRSASVSGRNGNIYQMENAWEEVTVSYQIFAGERTAGAAVSDFTTIVEWLNSADDYAVLTDTYDLTHYRMAVFVDEMDIESEWHTFGKATIKFRCKPQRFIIGDPVAVNDGDTITNTTNHIAKPIITLTGSGEHSMYQVDKTVASTNLGGMVYFKDQLLTEIGWVGYSNNGYNQVYSFYSASTASASGASVTIHDDATGTLQFTTWRDSQYSNYWGFGTALEVNPSTDYTLSCTVGSGETKIKIAFFNGGSSRTINSYAEATRTGAGNLTMTFRTPPSCADALIAFFRPDGTQATISSIMLVAGTEAKPFRGYVADVQNTLTIGDTSLLFSVNGFDTAVIDCERENLSIDGSDSNMIVMITDQYGNISPEYLKLNKGANVVNYSQDITSVTINPRMWEL